MLPTLLTLFLLGLTLLLFARRGFRIDNHPLCRKCKFDLVGHPSDATRCPECGSYLNDSSLTRGNRRRSPTLLYTGAWLTALTAFALACYLFLVFSGASLMPYKPLYLLRWDLTNPNQSTAAAREILSRITAGSLTESDLAPAIDELLLWQQNLHHPWSPQFGQIIETAHAHKLLAAARWEKYVANMFPEFSIHTRSRFHSADDFYLQISFGHPRNGETTISAPSIPVDVDADINFSPLLKFHWPLSATSFAPYGIVSITLPAQLPPLPVAAYHYTFEYTLTIHHPSGITVTRSGIIPFDFQIIPHSEPAITLLHDAATRDALVHAIHLDPLGVASFNYGEIHLPNAWFPIHDRFDLEIIHPPVPVSFKCELVQGPSHWPFENKTGFVIYPQNTNGVIFLRLDHSQAPTLPLHPGPATLLLTPDTQNLLSNYSDIDTSFGDPLSIPITILPPK